MDDPNEEFEPLFDYTRIQPVEFVCIDDDPDDSIFIPKKRKLSDSEEEKKEKKDVNVIDCDDKEDDEKDWLPPPKDLNYNPKTYEEDSTLKALRLKRRELASITESADEMIRAVEESVRKNLSAALQSSPEPKPVTKKTVERSKIVISIQEKETLKQFRVYKDDKFERLFKMYADRSKLDVKNLVFCFDGDKVSPAGTPDSLGMEDDDIIEVNVKSS
ncbi:hypothetical protein CASFOL_020588 [Castilleja foliolosa]|uniref:Rad60/SUMO-like domain-containing protein n=1 Tax=Castilleja foliolosa TaxID=1961234 RepID=A0ABD3D4W1_9LAMI